MTKCLRPDCPNEVVQTGKKPKKYCSSNCKQIVWQRKNKDKDPVVVYIDGKMDYKEGGLYRFENSEFVETSMVDVVAPIVAEMQLAKLKVQQFKSKFGDWFPENEAPDMELVRKKEREIMEKSGFSEDEIQKVAKNLGTSTLPLNKEDEKAFDAVPLLSVEQEMTPKKIGNNVGKGKPEKPEKVMPQGLSKSDQLRWMRENA